MNMASNIYNQVTEVLERNGFRFLPQAKGSHEMWMDKSTGAKVSVPSKILSRHTANDIIKSAKVVQKI